jgi:hypothetical protein
MPMHSKGRKRLPQAEVERLFWRLDLTCQACRRRTGLPHRIGAVYRRPNMEAVGTDMFVPPPLKIFETSDGTKIRALCSSCHRRGERSQPVFLDWSTLVYRLRIMELQGVHTAGRAV